MARQIDADCLKWKLGHVTLYMAGLCSGKTVISKILESYRKAVFEEIDNAPTVDAVEVVHGYDTGRCRIFHCSECGYGVDDIFQADERNYPVGVFNYCPNCGARMDLEVE